MGTGTAIIASAIIGGATSIYQSDQQAKLARDQQAALDAAEARQKAEAERIAKDTRPTGQTVGSAIKFGSGNDVTQTVNDFLVSNPKNNSSSSVSGVGNSGLGFVL